MSMPLLVLTLGIRKKETSLSLPERLEQPKTTQRTIFTIAKLLGGADRLYTSAGSHVIMQTLYNYVYPSPSEQLW